LQRGRSQPYRTAQGYLRAVIKENTGQSQRTNPVLSGGEKLKLLTLTPPANQPIGFGAAVTFF
jgi:hypothetical protein